MYGSEKGRRLITGLLVTFVVGCRVKKPNNLLVYLYCWDGGITVSWEAAP